MILGMLLQFACRFVHFLSPLVLLFRDRSLTHLPTVRITYVTRCLWLLFKWCHWFYRHLLFYKTVSLRLLPCSLSVSWPLSVWVWQNIYRTEHRTKPDTKFRSIVHAFVKNGHIFIRRQFMPVYLLVSSYNLHLHYVRFCFCTFHHRQFVTLEWSFSLSLTLFTSFEVPFSADSGQMISFVAVLSSDHLLFDARIRLQCTSVKVTYFRYIKQYRPLVIWLLISRLWFCNTCKHFEGSTSHFFLSCLSGDQCPTFTTELNAIHDIVHTPYDIHFSGQISPTYSSDFSEQHQRKQRIKSWNSTQKYQVSRYNIFKLRTWMQPFFCLLSYCFFFILQIKSQTCLYDFMV